MKGNEFELQVGDEEVELVGNDPFLSQGVERVRKGERTS